MKTPEFVAQSEVLDLGLRMATASLCGLQNSLTHPEFERFKAAELEKLKGAWAGRSYKDDPVLKGFPALFEKFLRFT